MDSGKILIGALAGLAVGATMGVLFASNKGLKIRRKQSRSGEDLIDDLRQKFEDYLEAVAKNLSIAKEEASDMMAKRNSQSQEDIKDMKNAMG